MPGEVLIEKRITNDHVFEYMFGLVKVHHRLAEQHIRPQLAQMCTQGDFVHTVEVHVMGKRVFSIEAHTKQVAAVMVGEDQLVGDMLIKKKKL